MGLYVSLLRDWLFRWGGVPVESIGGGCRVGCVQNGGD